MKILLTTLLLAVSTICFAQKETPAIYDYSNRNSYKIIDSFFTLDKKADFELVIQTLLFRRSGANFFVLSLKNEVWKARLFYQIYKDSGYAWKEQPLVNNPRIIYDSLIANGILTIRSQDKIKDSLAIASDFYIFDGATYVFQIKEGNEIRSFSFHCPKTWAKEFPTVKEFNQIVTLLKIIYLAFGLNDRIIC